MKKMKLFVVLPILALILTSCASTTATETAQTETPVNRGLASVSSVNWSQQYREATMVNIVTVNRYPASEDGMKEVSKQSDAVTITSQVYKSPGEKMQHSMLLFTVKNNPAISGQIVGNTGGSELSTKFTHVVSRMQKEGVTPKVASILNRAQAKLNDLTKISSQQRADGIKRVLFETRDQLLAAY